MLTPLAANAIELLMKRDSDDGRVFSLDLKQIKGKVHIYLDYLNKAATEDLGRPF